MSSYLGQNFLNDQSAVQFLVNLIKQTFQENNLKLIIEIGPGKGAITKFLSDYPVILFEKDETFLPILEKFGHQIIWGDVLQADIGKILSEKNLAPEQVLVFGNIPYYITSPIIRKFFENTDFGYGIFLIQKEVAEKIDSNANKKSYLWWLINYSHQIKYEKTIGKKSFSPAPKVDSAIISIQPGKKYNIKFENLKDFLELVSPYKRKTLGKISKILGDKGKTINTILEKNSTKRLEELNFQDLN